MSVLLTEKIGDLIKIGISEKVTNHILNYILTAPTPRLHNISPYRLADEWSANHKEVLEAFLHGTKTGIFDLEWDVKCPSCGGATGSENHLEQITAKAHCEYCKIDIQGGFDDAVEVTFKVNPNIKKTEDVDLGQINQAWLEFESPITLSSDPGENQEVVIDLIPGTYHMFSLVYHVAVPLKVTENKTDEKQIVEFTYDGNFITRGTEWLKSGPFIIRLKNISNNPVSLTFARAIEFPWVSGTTVASNQTFRDYFSSELISSDETFSIKNLVFVFTDIKSSTEMYEKRGDSRAYYLVKEHFKIMENIVDQNSGAIVKTIGDAVMATFLISSDAVKCVIDMHEAFDNFNNQENSLDDIIIKVGVHRGPCIAVTSNDKLDYFGSTVNIAARVQGLSGGSDIMISQDLYYEPGIQNIISNRNWDSKPLHATLKGIEGLFEVMHLNKRNSAAVKKSTTVKKIRTPEIYTQEEKNINNKKKAMASGIMKSIRIVSKRILYRKRDK
jgi:adenylate cyclase